MSDWGTSGPVLGPLKWVHTTYKNHIRACPVGGDDGIDLPIHDDMIFYDGIFYGDWSVFNDQECQGEIPEKGYEQILETKTNRKPVPVTGHMDDPQGE